MNRKTKPLVGVAKLLDGAMKLKGLSRDDLAKAMGIHRNHVYLIMQSLRPLPLKHLQTVSKLLDLSLSDIEQAQNELADYRKQGGPNSVNSILVEAEIAQGVITLEQLNVAQEMAGRFNGKLSFRLFMDLLREALLKDR